MSRLLKEVQFLLIYEAIYKLVLSIFIIVVFVYPVILIRQRGAAGP